MENIYHTIRGRTTSPRTLESISKDPLSAAKLFMIYDIFKYQIPLFHQIMRNAIPAVPAASLPMKPVVLKRFWQMSL